MFWGSVLFGPILLTIYLLPIFPAHAPVARPSVQGQLLEVGAECVSSAGSDLCGGWSAMAISTAMCAGEPRGRWRKSVTVKE